MSETELIDQYQNVIKEFYKLYGYNEWIITNINILADFIIFSKVRSDHNILKVFK